MSRFFTLALAATLVTTGIGLNVSKVSAQGVTAPGQALEIAPPLLTLSANPGETIKTELNLRNISGSKLLVKGQLNDFTANGEDGTPKIIFDESTDNPYSMRSWIKPLPTLTATPREIRKLPVIITVPKDAAPGGYYSVIRFTATPPDLEDTGVSLSASLGSLVLMRVKGEAKENLAIEEFTVGQNDKAGTLFESTPINFKVRLKNTGTVHQQPAGYAEIKDMFGKKVAIVNINQPPRNILPGSIRKFNAPLDSATIGKKMLFGRYTADLKLTYGSKSQPLSSSLTFWVVPYKLIGFASVALVGAAIAFYFMIRSYNRHIISRAQNGGSKKRK